MRMTSRIEFPMRGASSERVRCTIADGVGVALYAWFQNFEDNPAVEITHRDLSMKALQIVENMPPGPNKSDLQIKKKFNASAKWVGNWCKNYKLAKYKALPGESGSACAEGVRIARDGISQLAWDMDLNLLFNMVRPLPRL